MKVKTTKHRNKEVTHRVLKIVGLGVLIVVVSMLAPTFPYVLLRMYLRKKFNHNYSHNQLKNTVSYLKRKKFITYKNKAFILTKLGRKYLRRKALNDLHIKKVPWDRKWRVVTFDIPEDKAAERHIFRNHLKDMGFFHFQRSVFVIPYPCETEIDYLTERLGIEDDVHLLVAGRFRNDRKLIKHFKI